MTRSCKTLAASAAALFLLSSAAIAGINVEGSLSHEKAAQTGETYRGTLAIRNTGKTPADVKLYQTDYRFDASGRNDYAEPGSLPRSNARWIRPGQPQFHIPPGEVVHAPYEVRVPDDASLKGSYWSMIMVEPLAAAEAAPAAAKKNTVQLTQSIRYAVQIVTDVGAGAEPALAFTNPATSVLDGRKLFSIDVGNDGERWVRASFWLELYTLEGQPQAKIDGEKYRIYPGTSVRARFNVGEIPPGRYRALLVADGDGENLYGTELQIELR
ncbi:hypothetical protein [Aromatoleum aromaticum]|nr:hypothetical protein [Aromatoleum aromaticum]